jgi:hypothetical protein
MRTRAGIPIRLAALIAALFAITSPAHADWVKAGNEACQHSAYPTGVLIPDQHIYVCPFVDTQAFRHEQVSDLTVYGYDNSTAARVEAMACWTSLSNGEGGCGPVAQTSLPFFGYFELHPSLTAWSDPDAVVLLFVEHRKGSAFLGYRAED